MSKTSQPHAAILRVAEESAVYPAVGAAETIAAQTLYERDFVTWIAEQVNALRRRDFARLDLQNLIEECESMGRSEHREIRSRLTTLLMHLLKFEFQAQKRARSWASTIDEQRSEILAVLADSPCLRPTIGAKAEDVYPAALRRVLSETGLPVAHFPDRNPYSDVQMLDLGFYPGQPYLTPR